MIISERACDVRFSLRRWLLLGGDIESNPGPDPTQISKQLKEISCDIKDIKEKRLVEIEKQLGALHNLDDKINTYQEELHSICSVVQSLEKKVDELENYSRRFNLITYGQTETTGENS